MAAHYHVDPKSVIDRIVRRAGRSGEVRSAGGVETVGIYGVPTASIGTLDDPRLTVERLTQDDCLNISIGVYLEMRGAIQQSWMQEPASSRRAATAQGKPLPRLDAHGERCVDAAAAAYHLPQQVFRAVLRTEGGWVGLKSRNSNGTYDLGPGQINTIHLPELAKAGITEHMLVHDVCVNVHVAAYRLRAEIERSQDFWRGVGNYHSRTPHLHKAYLQRVIKNL